MTLKTAGCGRKLECDTATGFHVVLRVSKRGVPAPDLTGFPEIARGIPFPKVRWTYGVRIGDGERSWTGRIVLLENIVSDLKATGVFAPMLEIGLSEQDKIMRIYEFRPFSDPPHLELIGKGMGSACLSKIEEHCKQEGIAAILCYTKKIGSFFEHFGYKETKDSSHEYLKVLDR